MGLDPVDGSAEKICQKLTSCVAASSLSLAALALTAGKPGVSTFRHSQVSAETLIDRSPGDLLLRSF